MKKMTRVRRKDTVNLGGFLARIDDVLIADGNEKCCCFAFPISIRMALLVWSCDFPVVPLKPSQSRSKVHTDGAV
jgi:hypothetical protein